MGGGFISLRLNSLPFLFAWFSVCLFPLKAGFCFHLCVGPFLVSYAQLHNMLSTSRALLPQAEPGPNAVLKTNTLL